MSRDSGSNHLGLVQYVHPERSARRRPRASSGGLRRRRAPRPNPSGGGRIPTGGGFGRAPSQVLRNIRLQEGLRPRTPNFPVLIPAMPDSA